MTAEINGLATGIPLLYICYVILTIIIHLAFAAGVTTDAKRLSGPGGGLFLVGPNMWGFATLIGGIWVAAVYWLIHHSSLRSKEPPKKRNNHANQSSEPTNNPPVD